MLRLILLSCALAVKAATPTIVFAGDSWTDYRESDSQISTSTEQVPGKAIERVFNELDEFSYYTSNISYQNKNMFKFREVLNVGKSGSTCDQWSKCTPGFNHSLCPAERSDSGLLDRLLSANIGCSTTDVVLVCGGNDVFGGLYVNLVTGNINSLSTYDAVFTSIVHSTVSDILVIRKILDALRGNKFWCPVTRLVLPGYDIPVLLKGTPQADGIKSLFAPFCPDSDINICIFNRFIKLSQIFTEAARNRRVTYVNLTGTLQQQDTFNDCACASSNDDCDCEVCDTCKGRVQIDPTKSSISSLFDASGFHPTIDGFYRFYSRLYCNYWATMNFI